MGSLVLRLYVILALVASVSLLMPPGAAFAQQGRWEQAVAAGDEALARGEYDLAKERFETALEQSESFGPADSRRPESLIRLARLYRAQGDFAKPEDLYQQALKSAAPAFGPDDPRLAHVLHEVGRYYHARRKYGQAMDYYKEAFRIRVRALGREHADVAESINDLAMLYENEGVNDKAEVYYETALGIREKVLGPDHPDTITTLEHLARLFHKLQRGSDAAKLEQRARAVRASRVEQQSGPASGPAAEPVSAGDAIIRPPRLAEKVDPEYTEEARLARHEGMVVLQADVFPDGHAGNFRLLRSLGLGLDEKAAEAVRQWVFEPARQGKQRVTYRTTLEISFRLM